MIPKPQNDGSALYTDECDVLKAFCNLQRQSGGHRRDDYVFTIKNPRKWFSTLTDANIERHKQTNDLSAIRHRPHIERMEHALIESKLLINPNALNLIEDEREKVREELMEDIRARKAQAGLQPPQHELQFRPI